jgi:hypothetical protein
MMYLKFVIGVVPGVLSIALAASITLRVSVPGTGAAATGAALDWALALNEARGPINMARKDRTAISRYPLPKCPKVFVFILFELL